MKTLLFLNGSEGSQMGIEDGFQHLKDIGEIVEIKWFYYEDSFRKVGAEKTISVINEMAVDFQPQLIVFFHTGKFPLTPELIDNIKNISSKPILAYDEGDMYGGWSKPLSNSMKLIMKEADVISIRGLGKWYNHVKKYNHNIIYTPHSNSIYRFSKDFQVQESRDNMILFVGSRVKSRLGNIRRLHGAAGRENFVIRMSKEFPDKLIVHGKGWDDLKTNKGFLNFNDQIKVCGNAWVHISYEHYPEIPYYFSDRLPIALAAGQIYVCHYHEGYEEIFKGCDFIYFFKTEEQAIDIINYLLSLSEEELYKKAINARKFSDDYLSPIKVWFNFFNNIF